MAINLGIIGLSADKAAWATAAHVGPIKSDVLNGKYSLTAIATSRPETAESSAKVHGISVEKAYSSPEAIAKDPDVSLVVVSVKLPLHKQMAIPALQAKKDVFVEWPLASNLKDAEELAALAKEQGVKTLIGLQGRLTPSIQRAREIIKSGALGRITSTNLVGSNSMFWKVASKHEYINDPDSGANLISIPMAHLLDPLCYLFGEFRSLNATTSITFPEVEFSDADGKGRTMPRKFVDTVSVQGILQNGASANISLATTTKAVLNRFEWIINGEKGSLKFEGGSWLMAIIVPTLSQYIPKGEEEAKWEIVEVPDPIAYGGIGEVYKAFGEGKTEGLVDFDGAILRHKMVEAIYRSAEKGTRESY